MNVNSLEWKRKVFGDQLFVNLNEKLGEEGREGIQFAPWERRPMREGWCVNILDQDILHCGVKGYAYMNPKIYGVDYISIGKIVLVHDILTKYSVRNIYNQEDRNFFECDGGEEDRDIMRDIIHSLTGFFYTNDYSLYIPSYFREDDEIINKMLLCYVGDFWPRSFAGTTILMVDNCLYELERYVYLVGYVSREALTLGLIDRGEYAAYEVALKYISVKGFEITFKAVREDF
ncbi:Hypothetical predicted protein [Paramuricea clavata]|uniref:Uncharacterized protein n=1 Tax=Paramuricea clavata TaxID=317549 RepID=A0A6S7GA44_PARCT|nr:Hypothetical predicted protein [Paramuricea clavata]